MAGALQQQGSKRLVADYIVSVGGNVRICVYNDEFFYENGDLLKDRSVAEAMPEPFKAKAIRFVEAVARITARESKEETEVPAEPGATTPIAGTPDPTTNMGQVPPARGSEVRPS